MLFSTFTVAALAAVAAASPVAHKAQFERRQNGTGTACAQVSASVASILSVSPRATPTIAAQLAYDCITSVPLNASAASALVQSMYPYIQWQSTLSYLKDPPAEYVEKIQGPVDVYGELATIERRIANGTYKSEYEFGFAIYTLFQSTHDGHFVYIPDVVASIFQWGRLTPLVSVSSDGFELPKPYVYADVLAASFGNATFTPSAISQINGEVATTYLENLSQIGSLQDRDALYNNLFYELAQVSLGTSGSTVGAFAGGGRGRYVYPNATTTFTFENGTSVTQENFARVLVNFSGVTDGESLYQKFFVTQPEVEAAATSSAAAASTSAATSVATSENGSPSTSVVLTSAPTASASANATRTATASTTSTPAPGFPSPVIRHPNNLNGGYYLTGAGYEDVAVLNVASFVSAEAAEIPFQNVNQFFLNQSRTEGKTKLIIDVSANGGGTILQGYDLFKLLFPMIEPYGATRFRATEDFNIVGQQVSNFTGMFERSLNQTNATAADLLSSVFNYRTDVDVNGTNFDSWQDKFGPYEYHDDNFTSIIRWNLSDVLITQNSGGIVVTGYQNRTNFTMSPYAAEDVVIVYDGYCASTCTIFSELMRQQAGVQTVALGGRPRYAPQQAVGGVKGTNNFGWSTIQYYVETAYELASPEEQAEYNATTDFPEYFTQLPFDRAYSAPNVNVRDGIRQGDEEQTPLQFVYEPADCRIFYTPEMTVDISASWKAVADTIWGSKNWCVPTNGTATYRRSSSMPLMKRGAIGKARFDALTESLDLGATTLDSEFIGGGYMLP